MINTVSKMKFVQNRVGGRGVNLNLDNVFKYTGEFLRIMNNNVSSPLPKNRQVSMPITFIFGEQGFCPSLLFV